MGSPHPIYLILLTPLPSLFSFVIYKQRDGAQKLRALRAPSADSFAGEPADVGGAVVWRLKPAAGPIRDSALTAQHLTDEEDEEV